MQASAQNEGDRITVDHYEGMDTRQSFKCCPRSKREPWFLTLATVVIASLKGEGQ